MKKLVFIFIVLIITASGNAFSQEIRCRVNVQYSDIPDGDKDLFNEMRKNIEEFMNSQVWTDNAFEEQEKIDMRINIRLLKQNSNKNFSASIQIQSSRPTFNSTYSSTIINYLDEKFNFQYEENQTIEFAENSYVSNLSSVLSFYAYIILGLDYDTFSQQGGTVFYQKAQNIANAANASGESGWSSSDKENRYWLVENLLNSSYSGYRSAMYMYHRLGLDIMADKPVDGRKQIVEALTELEKIYRIKPSAFLLQIFFLAKKDEIIQIFSEGQPDEKQTVVATVKKMNPANASDYDKIIAK